MAAAIAIKFAENGINPILIGHRRESLLETSRIIGERAGTSLRPPVWREVDLAVMAAKGEEGFSRLTAELRNEAADLSIVVHGAGFARAAAFLETDLATYEATFAVNLTAPFFLTKEILRSGWMKEGVILNISSTVGESTHGWAGGMAYSMSKAAFTLWGQMMAARFAPGIRVNTLLPGSIDTPMADALLGAEGKKSMAA